MSRVLYMWNKEFHIYSIRKLNRKLNITTIRGLLLKKNEHVETLTFFTTPLIVKV